MMFIIIFARERERDPIVCCDGGGMVMGGGCGFLGPSPPSVELDCMISGLKFDEF